MRDTVWEPRQGNPYGTPGTKGNADELWQKLQQIPCPNCGAKSKRLSIDGKKATIYCY